MINNFTFDSREIHHFKFALPSIVLGSIGQLASKSALRG
jgi:hypothetical protein